MKTPMQKINVAFKTLAGAGLALIPAASALAQDAPQAPSWDVSGIARIDTQISDNGTCKQRLPNLIVNAKRDNWKLSGAIKVDNLEAADGCFGKHDARPFFATATYTGLQNHGITLKGGMFTPFEFSSYSLKNAATHVLLNDAQQLDGGIVGFKIDKNILKTNTTSITLNGGIGTKPDWTERFGASSNTVIVGGTNATHAFSDALKISGKYSYIKRDQGENHFASGRLQHKGKRVDFGLYAETTQSNFSPDKFSIMGDMVTPLTAKTDWQFAAGLIDGDKAIETSLYQQITKDLRATIGVGHNIDKDAQTVRIGLLQKLDF